MSLRDALDQMRSADRSGIVYQQEDKYRLLEAPVILENLPWHADEPIASIEGGIEIEPMDVAKVADQSSGPLMDIQDLYKEVKRSGAPYGILAHSSNQVILVTSEQNRHAMLVSGPCGCFCSKSHRESGGKTGDDCPTGDGGTLVCTSC